MRKQLKDFRSFPHSNSKRKIIDRYKDDRDEAEEYTRSFSTLRTGGIYGGSCPDYYEDDPVYEKYPVKPKKNDHKGKATIRKPDTAEEDNATEEDILVGDLVDAFDTISSEGPESDLQLAKWYTDIRSADGERKYLGPVLMVPDELLDKVIDDYEKDQNKGCVYIYLRGEIS